jgi:hypothetical protein
MKKIYEVRINTVSACEGRRNGYKAAGYTLTAEKAEELRALTVEKIHNTSCWWMTVAKNNNGEADVVVVELGEVWE